MPVTDDTDPRYEGEWWLANAPEKRVGGVLEIEAGQVGRLLLLGAFDPAAQTGEQVIHGSTTNAGAITIESAYFTGQSFRAPDLLQDRFEVDNVLIGAHIHAPKAQLFSHAYYEFESLPDWLDAPSVEVVRGPSEAFVGLSVELKDAVSFSVLGVGRFTLAAWPGYATGRDGGSVTITATMGVELDEALTLDQVEGDVTRPLLYFLTMANGRPERLSGVSLEMEAEEPDRERVGFISSDWIATRPSPDRKRWETGFFKFADIEDRASQVLERWFALHRECRPAIEAYFAPRLAASAFVEDTFIRTVSALETLHRTRFNSKPLSRSEFRELLDTIESAVNRQHWEFLETRLRFANGPTLRERLDELLDEVDGEVAASIRDLRDFTARVVKTRNALAHRSDTGDAFTDHEAVAAVHVLDLLFNGYVGRVLGFSSDEVHELAFRSFRTRHLLSTPGPLS